MQHVDDVASVMPKESPAPIVVVGVAGVAEIGDGFVRARRVLTGNHMRLAERHCDHATRTQTITPLEPQIGLVRDGIEPAAGGHGDVACLQTGGHTHVPELHVVPRTTIAVDSTSELLSTRTCLHHPATYFTVSHFPDA